MEIECNNFIYLPHCVHACHLGSEIALFKISHYSPMRGKWVSLDPNNREKWYEQFHGRISNLETNEEKEILESLEGGMEFLDQSQRYSFKSGTTLITLVPSAFNYDEVFVFDHTRYTWLPFNWETQWYDLRKLGLRCKPITIQRRANKAFGILLFFEQER